MSRIIYVFVCLVIAMIFSVGAMLYIKKAHEVKPQPSPTPSPIIELKPSPTPTSLQVTLPPKAKVKSEPQLKSQPKPVSQVKALENVLSVKPQAKPKVDKN